MGAERGRASPGQPYCSACSVEMELAMIIPPFRTPYGLKDLHVSEVRALGRLRG
jgi:hypothetical protein